MTTNFPSSLDAFTNPSATDAMDSVTVPHATQHADLNDAVEALQAKVGVDGSAVTTSLDYKVANQGLTLITPTSVSNGTLSGATVVASSTATVQIDGVFSADFDHYKIMGRIWGGSTAFALYYRFRTPSGNVTSTDYWWSYLGLEYLGNEARTFDTSHNYGYTGAGGNTSTDTVCTMSAEVFNPYSSTFRTAFQSLCHINSATYFGTRTGAGGHRNQESHTGITFTTSSSPTFSAEFRIYGYNNG